MCLSIPGKVISLKDKTAEIEAFGVRRQVFVAVDDLKVGNWVLVSGGIALAKLDEAAAAETSELLEKLQHGKTLRPDRYA